MNKFRIDESEKARILGLHETATKKQYLKEDLEQSMTDIERYNYQRGVQCFLNKKGIKDNDGNELKLDGSIGNYPKSKSAQAIYKYQNMLRVVPDGVWGEDTMEAMPEADKKIFRDCISEYGDLFDKLYHWLGWDE